MMKYVKLFGDLGDIVDELSDEEAGRLMKAVLLYARTGETLALSGAERIVFKVLLAQFERDRETYDARVENGRINRAKLEQLRATASKAEQNRVNVSKTEQEEDKEKDKDKDQDKEAGAPSPAKRGRFVPPSPEEVLAYCIEKGYPIDAGRFCDYYASKGWRVGSSPMKDWMAAVRAWARREEAHGPPGGFRLGNLGKGAVDHAGGLSGNVSAAQGGRFGLPDDIL